MRINKYELLFFLGLFFCVSGSYGQRKVSTSEEITCKLINYTETTFIVKHIKGRKPDLKAKIDMKTPGRLNYTELGYGTLSAIKGDILTIKVQEYTSKSYTNNQISLDDFIKRGGTVMLTYSWEQIKPWTYKDAMALYKKRDYLGCIKILNGLIKKKPNDHLYKYRKGKCYGKLNRIPEAIASFNAALKDKSDHKYSLMNRADHMLMLRKGIDYKMVISDYQKSVSILKRAKHRLEVHSRILYAANQINDRKTACKAVKDIMQTVGRTHLIFTMLTNRYCVDIPLGKATKFTPLKITEKKGSTFDYTLILGKASRKEAPCTTDKPQEAYSKKPLEKGFCYLTTCKGGKKRVAIALIKKLDRKKWQLEPLYWKEVKKPGRRDKYDFTQHVGEPVKLAANDIILVSW